MKDIDYFVDKSTFEECTRAIDAFGGLSGNSFGFHVSSGSADWFQYLYDHLQPGQLFPLQIMSGPALTIKYFSALPEKLVELVKTRRIRLCVHLPFVVTFYKPFAQLLYQRQAFQELSSYYRQLGILDDVYVLAHSGHPTFDPTGNSSVQWSYWREEAVKNILSCLTYFPNFLLENLVGFRGEAFPFSSPNFLYEQFLKHPSLEGKSRLGLALDTEHLFGSGETLSSLTSETLSRVKFVHFNASPSSVFFGSRIDLHSYTKLETALSNNYGPFCQEGSSLQDYQTLGLLNIPAVFERKNMSTQISDYGYLKSYFSL